MFKTIRIGKVSSPLIVAGVFGEGSKLPRHLSALDKESGGSISEALRRPGFKAEPGEITPANNSVIVLGLGRESDLTAETLRMIGAKLIRALDRMAPRAVQLFVSEAIDTKTISHNLAGRALAEGIAVANWRVDQFAGSATRHEPQRSSLTIDAAHKSFANGMKDGLLLGESTNYTRALAATPPNICNPTWVAQQARKLARETGLKCTVINFSKAKQLGMGGIVNVGKASNSKPCLIILEHNPRKVSAKAKGKTIALVGKTITYDTGGYSLKISGGMKGMKYDKNGGMAVLGAMRAIAKQKTPVKVVALLPCAENMVSGEAYRPDDIITMYNKVSVEVTNTDAEGRLVLGDALAYACDKYKPAAIIDAATLTGGVVVALGKWSAGVWANDDTLFSRVQDAADVTGEKIWRMPLWNEHKDFMRAKHADVWNSAPARDGHPIQGAAFLSYFVDDEVPWAHVDIAGMSAVDSDTDMFVQGPTGFGVRLLAEAAASFARR